MNYIFTIVHLTKTVMELHCLLIILAMFSLDRSVVSANGLLWRQHVFHGHNTNRYNAHIHILVELKKTSVTFATCNCFESLKTSQLGPIYAFTILRVAQFSSLILLNWVQHYHKTLSLSDHATFCKWLLHVYR